MKREDFVSLSREKKLAHLSAMLGRSHEAPIAVPADPANQGVPFESASLQQSYLLARSGPAPAEPSHLYQEFELTSPDIRGLEAAWNQLLRKHPMLRARLSPGGLWQICPQETAYRLPVQDVPENPEPHLATTRREMIEQAPATEGWPLFSLRVSKMGPRLARLHLLIDLIVADARSVRALYRELASRYLGQSDPGPPVERSFRDYQIALGSYRRSPASLGSRQFWERLFDSVAPAPQLARPAEIPRAGVSHERLSMVIPHWDRLRARCTALGIDPDIVRLVAFTESLSRWCDQEAFTVLFVSWKRPPFTPDPHDLVGELTSLCWYEHRGRGLPFLEHVRQAQQQIDLQLQHRAADPLAALRRRIRRAADGNRAFPVVLTGTLPASLVLRSPLLSEGFGITRTAGVFLDAVGIDDGQSLHCHWDVDARRLDPALARTHFDSHGLALAALATDPELLTRPEKSPFPEPTSLPERHRVLHDWNDTRVDYDREVCCHQLFERQCQRNPDAPALECAGSELSYGQLNARANQLARWLVHRGLKPGDLVGICLERSREMVVALLATMKAGGAYVPMDAEESGGRIEAIAAKAELRFAISNARLRDRVQPHIPQLILLDDEAAVIGAQPGEDLNLAACRSDGLAYVIFTSGSTGTPKGVAVRHRPVINLIEWAGREFSFGPQDTVLFTNSLGFDLSVFDIFGMLAFGARIVIVGDKARRNSQEVARLLASKPITFWNSAPAVLSLLVSCLDSGSIPMINRQLRLVFLSGDWIPLTLPDGIRRHFAGAEVISLGGATEATVWSNYFRIGAIDPSWVSIPYGRPIQNARYYILDEGARPCPVGREGDLYIGGECLSDGYLNDPALTAQAFIRDPFVSDPAGIMYCTGDRARFLADGNIEFLGRRDFQVKVRGYRIELGEIEHRLRSHNQIRDAVVLVKQTTSGDQKIVAYLVPADGQIPEASALRDFVREKLPEYMLPNVVVPIDTLPVTANGKIDRAALPWPPPAAPPAALHRAAPSAGPDHGEVTRFIRELLAADLPGTHVAGQADLFDCGATSLTITRLTAALARRFGVQVSIESVLEEPTLDAIARAVSGGRPGVAPGAPGPVDLAALNRLLERLADGGRNGERRHLYPSAGGIYSTQVYLAVPSGAVRSLSEGVYYYHPIQHRLYRLAERCPEAGRHAGYRLYLVADTRALAAIYGPLAGRLALLDAGYLAQLALGEARQLGLALHPDPAGDFGPSRLAIGLPDAYRFCLCLSPSPRPASGPQPDVGLAAGDQNDDIQGVEGSVPFRSPVEQERIKRELTTIRQLEPAPFVQLDRTESPDQLRQRRRSTRREFMPQAIAETSLIGLLRSVPGALVLAGPGLAGLPPAYISVRARAVQGLEPGLYAYDWTANRLIRRAADCWAALRRCHLPFNRQVYDRAGFAIFLLADRRSSPALLQGGMIGQVLMDHQSEHRLGLCPIGAVVGAEAVLRDLDPSLESQVLHGWVGGAAEDPARVFPSEAGDGEIAVIGVACRFPEADNPEQYWRNLCNQRCSLGPLPLERRRQLGIGGAAIVRGGFLEDIARFDHRTFKISPVEAKTMDPQERLFLELAWECLENAGYSAAELARTGTRVGVIVGAMWSDYQALRDRVPAGAPPPTSLSSAIANRVSWFFDLKGPSLAVDTSCSSGVTALHLGCEALRRGECDAVLVGAVNLVSSAQHPELLESLGLLSRDQRCQAFAPEASGWVLGEGGAAVLLRRQRTAEQAGDNIRCLIKASAIGHTGRTPRYSMPSAGELATSIRGLLERSGLSTEDIGYVECAAAGANLADAAELTALGEVFAGRGPGGTPCLVGSVKPNIGHLESASALSQLIKVIEQLHRGQIAPTLFSGTLNPLARLDGEPLRVNRELRPWCSSGSPGGSEPAKIRRALINAAGASGSFGHIIAEQALPRAQTVAEDQVPVLVPLSADTPEQLRELAQRLRDHLAGASGSVPRLRDVGHTLQVGRMALKHRLVILASSVEQLSVALGQFLAGSRAEGVHAGQAAEPVKGPDASPADDDLDRLARDWVAGRRELQRLAQAQRIPLPGYPFARTRHWISGLESEPSSGPALDPGPASVPPDDGLGKVEAYLRAVVAEAAEMPVGELDPTAPLEDYGINSLMITRITARLGRDLGPVSSTLLFEHRRLIDASGALLEAKREQLHRLLRFEADPPSPAGPVPGTRRDRADGGQASRTGDLAIVGLAGRYPGASDLEAFWRNLSAGVDSITEIPPDRWRVGRDGGASYCRWGSFIADHDRFDPLFFGVSPREAATIDPHERLFLELSWELFENAGYSLDRLAERFEGRVGVFAGVMYGEYEFFGVESTLRGRPMALGAHHASVANRVSYFYDFQGPSLAIDTMCSSSMTALHLACRSIEAGDCLAAVVGGVNFNIHPNKFLAISQLGMGSRSGRCRPFSDGADGFVPGEGGGALLVRPLADAEEDGDNILAVIKATAVNHGGRTNGYTVPNPARQARMVETALARAAVDPRTITYVEAHGTGTSLGDPIEIAGLTRAFAPVTAAGAWCAIGSVKSNIGHLEAAAGIAGITKVLLQMKHGKLAPSLHAKPLNPRIDFAGSPFHVQTALGDWEPPGEENGRPGRRRAAVSAFGAGGSNGHVILEEYRREPERVTGVDPGPQIVLLSARSGPQLSTLASRMADWLGKLGETGADDRRTVLADLAYTTQVGRTALGERLAIVCSSLEDLLDRLAGFLSRREDLAGCYRSTDVRGRYAFLLSDAEGGELLETLLRNHSLTKLAHLWSAGVTVPWSRLARSARPKLLSLPNYPFEKQRCWIDQEPEREALAPAPAPTPARPAGTLLLRPEWVSGQPTGTVTRPRPGRQVLFAAGDDFSQRLAQVLGPEGLVHVVGFGQVEDHARLFRELGAADSNEPLTVSFAGPGSRDDTTIEERLAQGIHELIRLLRGWMVSGLSIPLRLQCFYPSSGGQQVADGRALAGALRSASAELARFDYRVVGLDVHADERRWSRLAAAPWNGAEVRLEEDQLLIRRYRRLSGPPPSSPSVRATWLERGGVYLITGGGGGIGLKLAEHMARSAAATIVLASRRPPDRDRLHALTDRGSTVLHRTVDLGDRASVAALVAGLRRELGGLSGLIHAAGSLADSLLINKTEEQVTSVLSGKVLGLTWLDHELRDERLDFVLVFSSLVAAMGNAGQTDYGFANAYLGYFAEWRAGLQAQGQRHGRTVAIDWPYWAEGGMRLDGPALQRLSKQTGLRPLPTEQALRLLDQIMSGHEQHVTVAHGDLDVLEPFLASRLGALDGGKPPRAEPLPEPPRRPAGQDELAFVMDCLARETGASLPQLDPESEFSALGMTSLMTASMISDIADAFGIKLYVNELQLYNTGRKLADHLQRERKRQPRTTGAANGSNGTSESKPASAGPPPPSDSSSPLIFILSAPRSGSTLLRVMLMGHSQLFAPPELHLLPFESLMARRRALEKQNRTFLREGLIETLKELLVLDAAGAHAVMEKLEADDLSTAATYAFLKQRCRGRHLVDKSPTYAESLSALERSLEIDPGARYLFLYRHPAAMMESFVRNRFSAMLGMPGDPWKASEALWRTTNRNVLEFIRVIPPERKHFLRYEDLVSDPEQAMRALCAHLAIDFQPALLTPYADNRMTSGLHPGSTTIGDPAFHTHERIDPSLAGSWRSRLERGLCLDPATIDLARTLGYREAEDWQLDGNIVPESRPATGADGQI
jgi:amino acid adenylation domain-containing protein